VTFNWREYTYDHVRRVFGLASNLARLEGADAEIVALSALLHDITKPYDGEYVTDAKGQRVTDDDGYWRNSVRQPVGHNEVTALYDERCLEGKLHNVSGAEVARALLARRGLQPSTCRRVAETIAHHLSPPDGAPIESLCLYDADTIDANIGLPAFVRNIYINLHFYPTRQPDAPPLDDLLTKDPLAYLRPYVTERLAPWIAGKERDFVPKLRTVSGRQLAERRLIRLRATVDALDAELDEFGQNGRKGALSVVLHYMAHRESPSIHAETVFLADQQAGSDEYTSAARALVAAIQQEIAGES
jgi:putative nucleotidyltransferase with HDIG domain